MYMQHKKFTAVQSDFHRITITASTETLRKGNDPSLRGDLMILA
jgi:hypothetical protein